MERLQTDKTVSRVETYVNGLQLNTPLMSDLLSNTREFLFSRAGLQIGDRVEVIVYNGAGNELERISTVYPIGYNPISDIKPNFYSIKTLLNDPILFNQILDKYSMKALRFVAN